MYLLDPLTSGGTSPAADRPFCEERPPAPLNLAIGALIGLPAYTALRTLRLAHKGFSVLAPAKADGHLGPCVDCGAPVLKGDAFIRYRGHYYHAQRCAESNPPALRRRSILAARATT
jgi:hypothetical protein